MNSVHSNRIKQGVRAIRAGTPLIAMACVVSVHAQPTYEVIDLGVLPGGSESTATAINENGVVVGLGDTSTEWQRAFVWDSGVMTPLPIEPTTTRSWPKDINDAGVIVGVEMNESSEQSAIIWAGDEKTLVPTLGGHQNACNAIDDSGHVVGWSMFSPDPAIRRMRPFVYDTSNGELRGLPILPGGTWNGASAISDDGRFIAGDGQVGRRSSQMVAPILYGLDGSARSLGTLGGVHAYANGVNDDGWVVGSSRTGAVNDAETAYIEHAFLYANERMIDLGLIFGDSGRANAVNNNGVIVGVNTDRGDFPWEERAFIVYDNEMIDLNTLIEPGSGWTITVANDINDRGVIVGSGVLNGEKRAVVLRPQ